MYPPHIFVIPGDDANRQLAGGFILHDQVDARRVDVKTPARGWRHVLEIFTDVYIKILVQHRQDHVVMLIDFDGDYDARRAEFEKAIPEDLKSRGFVVGPKQNPEILTNKLGKSLERIGLSLAHDCFSGPDSVWGHEQLGHNDADLKRPVEVVRPILFDVQP